MRYVPSLPPIVEPPQYDGAVKPAASTTALAPVQERSLPPIIFRQHRPAARPDAINRHWRPRADAAIPDRRLICRRTQDAQMLLDLRSGPDRRRHCQRKNDMTTAIDEKI